MAPPSCFGEALGEVERRGAAGVIVEQRVELGLKGGVGLGDFVFALELDQRGHERLRHVAAAVDAEAAGARFGGSCRKNDGCHEELLRTLPRRWGTFSVLGGSRNAEAGRRTYFFFRAMSHSISE